ncbi:MAG: zf-HC2 domain-containing protein [Planctomycetota bacterium]|nr:zf-HC2 domain-containing protein [Planctomycetota bacterium]
MNCTQAHDLIHAELDGDITAEQQRALQTHTESCELCSLMQAQFRAMEKGFDWLAEQSEVVPSAALAKPTVIRGPWVRRAAAIAVAAAACVAFYLALPFGGPQGEVEIVSAQPAQPKLEFRLTGESFDKYLAVEQESTEPNVHIVWLYKNQGFFRESSQVDCPTTLSHS